jgi:hypothetical protein
LKNLYSTPQLWKKNKTRTKKIFVARPWWLTPVILATQQAEIRGITVQSQPRQIVPKTLSQKGLLEWLRL